MANAAGDAHPYPVYGAHYLLTFPILDADGDLVTGATGLDSEISKDLGTFADCTNEATELATSSGMYYLYLTGAEMSAKMVTVQTKTTSSGAKTTVNNLYPIRLPSLETGTAQAGAAGTITLASGASSADSYYNGLFVLITNDSPAGAQYQLRRVVSYVGSTRVATIDSNWGTNPSSASTYDILIPEGYSTSVWAGVKVATPATAGIPDVNTKNLGGTAQTGRDIGASVLLSAGTGAGQLDFTSGVLKSNLTQIDGQATSGNNATLNLAKLNIVNSAGDAIVATSSGSNGNGMNLTGQGTGSGLKATGGTTSGKGIYALASASQAIRGEATGGNNPGMAVYGANAEAGFIAQGGATDAPGFKGIGQGTGAGMSLFGGSGGGDGLTLIKSGAGVDFRGNITGNITGNLSGSVGSVASGGIDAASIANGAIDAASLATDMNTYQAKVWVFDDNSGSNDRYAVVWHKNGQPITSGITTPTIQVFKVADGTDLVASTAMTQIGATGTYRYTEGTNRIINGVAYIVKVSADIDSATRVWYQPVGRDSA